MNLNKLRLPRTSKDVKITIPLNKYLSQSDVLKKHLSSDDTFFINSPVGSGKTYAVLSYHVEAYLNNNQRAIYFIVPSRVLANQLINIYKHEQIYKDNKLFIGCPKTLNNKSTK